MVNRFSISSHISPEILLTLANNRFKTKLGFLFYWIILVTNIPNAGAQSRGCRNVGGFECITNDLCIDRIKWQDGRSDCPDGSDEVCLPWQYDCKFGKPRCIDLESLNDGSIDCMSGFDELERCSAESFVCMDRSRCIPSGKYLDGQNDCTDGSDELCPAAHFPCHDRSRCVPAENFQDGIPDCDDGSDEECNIFQYECHCGEPRCVSVEAYHDGYKNCSDGSDEYNLSKPSSVPKICKDGGKPRKVILREPRPPSRPPMVPCKPEEDTCNPDLKEMCSLVSGVPRCLCFMDHIRPHGSARCVPAQVIVEAKMKTVTLAQRDAKKEEIGAENLTVQKSTPSPTYVSCQPNRLDSCPGQNEQCVENDGIFGCACKEGFVRNPETNVCFGLVNECNDPLLNDCDASADCMDNPLSYECFCRPGYLDMSESPETKPGVHCRPLINECLSPLTHQCDVNAECIDLAVDYTCRCKPGYRDISPNRARMPGRVCAQDVNECLTGQHDCHEFAICTDVREGFHCRCPVGYVDLSIDPVRRPGRQCALLVNECVNVDQNDCDAINGECTDTAGGFVCQCKPGFIDEHPSNPGRRCTAGDRLQCP